MRAAFLARIPGIDAATDRETALARLKPVHDALAASLGFPAPIVTAEQVHVAQDAHDQAVVREDRLPGQRPDQVGDEERGDDEQ